MSGAAPDFRPGAQAPAARPERSPVATGLPAGSQVVTTGWRGKAWFWLPIVPLVALDLWSKTFFFRLLETHGHTGISGRPELPVWDGPVSFMIVQQWNPGTIWGLFQGYTAPLMVLRSVAIVLLVYFAWRAAPGRRLMLLVLGLITAGAIGNLYDNFTQDHGGVRDFLRFHGTWPWKWDFPAFNVADSCICVGAFTLAFLLWRQPEPGVARTAPPGP